jgi:hypothetical protein
MLRVTGLSVGSTSRPWAGCAWRTGVRCGRSRRTGGSGITRVGTGLRRWAAGGVRVVSRARPPCRSGLGPGGNRGGVAAVLAVVAGGGKVRRHAPGFFARLAGGGALVVDSRPLDRIGKRDLEAFAAARDACAVLGWRYAVQGSADPVQAANLRWLAGYRHPQCHDEPVAALLREVCEAAAAYRRRGDGRGPAGHAAGAVPPDVAARAGGGAVAGAEPTLRRTW